MTRWELLITVVGLVGAGIICATILTNYYGSIGQTTEDAQGEAVTTRAVVEKPSAVKRVTPRRIITLEERGPRQGGFGGYYVWLLIDPMTKPELEGLGNKLIAHTQKLRGNHLKAWVFYQRLDYDLSCTKSGGKAGSGCSALWMNATRSGGWKLDIVGPVPECRTPRAYYRAFVKWDPIFASIEEHRKAAGRWLVSCEYDETASRLICYDRYLSLRKRRHLCMPALIGQMVSWSGNYLPPSGYAAWATIPGLKEIVVHLYWKNDEPIATITFGRKAYESSVLARDNVFWRRLGAIHDMDYDGRLRLSAKVIGDKEYEAILDQCAYQKAKLYEESWMKVAGDLRIELHQKLPFKVPPGFRF